MELSQSVYLIKMEICSRLLYITLILLGKLIDVTTAFPTSESCEDFSSKCALVQEAAAYGLADMMCNTEENGEKLAHFCPVTCDICMGKYR